MPAQERWLPVPGFHDYAVSDQGHVASTKGGQFRILAGGKTQMGYRNVLLYQNGERVSRRVHQLVALAFHGSRPDGLEIRHLDGNQLNNAASNLAYGTAEENYWDKKLHNGTLLILPGVRTSRLNRAGKRWREHCKNGHERIEANTYVYPDGKTVCRPCLARNKASWRARNAARNAGLAVSA